MLSYRKPYIGCDFRVTKVLHSLQYTKEEGLNMEKFLYLERIKKHLDVSDGSSSSFFRKIKVFPEKIKLFLSFLFFAACSPENQRCST